jgi:uncharacterized membrane protein HdeD (DUF308 family)
MDLHALCQGRSMLLARAAAAFLIGVVASNNATLTAGALVTLFGVWTLLDGAATVWQAYQPTGPDRSAELTPAVRIVGGIGILVGVLAVLDPGFSDAVLTWVLAAWFAFRAVTEIAVVASRVAGRIRVVLTLVAVADLGLVALLATHTSGSVADVSLFGGGLASVWGLLLFFLAAFAGKTLKREDVGPRLLAPR